MEKINHRLFVLFIIFSIILLNLNTANKAIAKNNITTIKNIEKTNSPSEALTLKDAIKTAITHNPQLKASVFSEKMAESNLQQAKSGFMPKINFQETFNRTNNPMWAFGTLLNQGKITTSDFAPSSLNNPDAINNFTSLLSIAMPVYTGGRIYNTFKIAEINKQIAKLAHKKTKQAIIAQTALAYTNVLLAEKNLEVIQHAIKSAKASLKMMKSRYGNGFSVKSDLLRAQVRIANLEQQRLKACSSIEIAKGYLNTAMGIPLERPVNTIPYFDNSFKITGKQDQFILKGMANRPELKILKLRKKIAESEIKIAESANLPNINIFGTYEDNSERLDRGHNDYSIGAVMKINLFSGFNIQNGIKTAESALSRIRELEKNMRFAVKIQIKESWLDLKTSCQRINVAESALAQAVENLRIVRNRYQNGIVTIVTLLDAELADQKARANHFQAIYDYESARIKLAIADGTIDNTFH